MGTTLIVLGLGIKMILEGMWMIVFSLVYIEKLVNDRFHMTGTVPYLIIKKQKKTQELNTLNYETHVLCIVHWIKAKLQNKRSVFL